MTTKKKQTATSMGMISGTMVDVFDMHPSEVKAWDIVWGLHHQCRYNGQIPVNWDVLSHSALCYAIALRDCQQEKTTMSTANALGILLHYSGEAFISDMITPLKTHFHDFVRLEEKVQGVILNRFGLRMSDVDWDYVKHYDNEALWTEQAQLYRTQDLIYGNSNFNKTTMLRLVKCSPVDFIDQLRTLAIQRNVQLINELFKMPEILKPYLGRNEPLNNHYSDLDEATDVTEEKT